MESSGNAGTTGPEEAIGDVERQILRAVAGIAYGSVEIVVHDGRVVQIERREKVRFAGGEAAPGGRVRPIR